VAARDEPGEKCTGLMNRTDTAQHNYGASGQFTVRQMLPASVRARNQFTAGGAFDRSTMGFLQTTEIGYVNPERGITPLNVFADGAGAGTIDGVPYDNRVDLSGSVTTVSAFATNTLSIADAWHITLSGRFNRTDVDNLDRITPASGTGSLTGDHTFNRFNPSAGVTFSPARQINLYAGYSEGSRAPTSIELGCADPQSPCKLPNALIGDPPLEQVVTRTWEAGVRGGRPELRWNAGVFRATNANDVLFVAATATGFGYFKNFGETRRQGVELGASGRRGRVTSGVNYAFTAATYETDEVIAAESNSSNRGGVIAIHPGDRIPLIPRHAMKAWMDVQATRRVSFDVDAIATSGSTARGNENGAHQPDGVRYLGPGSTPGYAIVSAGVRVSVTRRVQAIAQLNNIFDAKYYSASQLGPAAFSAAGTFVTSRTGGPSSTFYAPGAPATFWAGLRVTF
jgi:outer membrane receptor protein involved in Fe transport